MSLRKIELQTLEWNISTLTNVPQRTNSKNMLSIMNNNNASRYGKLAHNLTNLSNGQEKVLETESSTKPG